MNFDLTSHFFLQETVDQAQNVQKDGNDRPLKDVFIQKSGSSSIQPFVASEESVR